MATAEGTLRQKDQRTGKTRLRSAWRLESNGYQAVFAANRKLYGRTVVVWVARGSDAGRKAGVVVSKRVFSRAVDRNRAKRLMREGFRAQCHTLAPDVRVILVARQGIAGKTSGEVARELAYLFRKGDITSRRVKPREGL